MDSLKLKWEIVELMHMGMDADRQIRITYLIYLL